MAPLKAFVLAISRAMLYCQREHARSATPRETGVGVYFFIAINPHPPLRLTRGNQSISIQNNIDIDIDIDRCRVDTYMYIEREDQP